MDTTQINHGNWAGGQGQQLSQFLDNLQAQMNTFASTSFDIPVLTLPADYPVAVKGDKWRVTAGQIGGTGPILESGDLLIAIADSPIAGSHALYGANFIEIQKDIAPITVAILRLGASVVDYVTTKALADQGVTFSAATIVDLRGGTTSQLALTASAAQKGLTITGTAVTTGNALYILSGNNDANNQVVYLETSMTTAFSTAKTLNQVYVKHTSNGTDVDGATVNGFVIDYVSTALSKISNTGFKYVASGTASAAAGTQALIGLNVIPTVTINSATTTLIGVNIDYSGITNTASANIYGVKISGTNGIGIDLTGTYAGHGIYIHPTSFATGKRAFRIADYGTELEVAGGEGIIRTYTKTTTGTGATALQFHWGYNTVAAVGLIGSQEQFESQVAAVGSVSLMGRDVIVGIAAGGFMATTAADMTQGLIGGRFKVYADVTSTCNGSVSALWLDHQMSCAVAETESCIRVSTGGTVPDAFALFTTTSAGITNLFYFDASAAAHDPVVTSFAGNGAMVVNNKGTLTQLGQFKCYVDGIGTVYVPFFSVA